LTPDYSPQKEKFTNARPRGAYKCKFVKNGMILIPSKNIGMKKIIYLSVILAFIAVRKITQEKAAYPCHWWKRTKNNGFVFERL